MTDGQRIFISRAGADAEFAAEIARILRNAGYETILQQENFGHQSFLNMISEGLESSSRVVALLSEDYQNSDYCTAEWQVALHGDVLNRKERLIVFRIAECQPLGLMRPLPYVDLAQIRHNRRTLENVVRDALQPDSRKGTGSASTWWRTPKPILDEETIRPVPSFTGREQAMSNIQAALAAGSGAAVTQPAAVHGLGGIGKSALAREYAWQHRDEYAVVWWLNAATETEIVESLIRLGMIFLPELEAARDRANAARHVLTDILPGLGRRVLLVFDNVDDQKLFERWRPHNGAHVLVTSRLHGWGRGVTSIDLPLWLPGEAAQYLLDESGRLDITQTESLALADDLGHLPLALSHAAAYLKHNHATSIAAYRKRIERRMAEAPPDAEYDRAVFATFQEALVAAEKRAPGAAAIANIAASCAPDDIPFELFEQDAEHYPESVREPLADEDQRVQALSALADLSLITLRLADRVLAMHRLVQAAVRHGLGATLPSWISAAISAADAAFPFVKFENWPTCKRLASHAEAIVAHAPESFGKTLSRLLNQTGCYLNEQAQYAKAEPLFRRALAIDEKSYGPDHPEVATDLNNLALLLRATNRLAEAEPLYRRALAITERSYGPDHPVVALGLNNLAELLRTTNRLTEAEPLYLRALAIDEKSYGPDHPDVATDLINLALLLHATNRLAEAEPLFRRALAIDEKSYGADHPVVAICLSNLAGLFQATNRLAEAEPLFRRALAIDEKSYGPDHPEVATDLINLASLLYATNRLAEAEAEALATRAVTIFETALGADHPHTTNARNGLNVIHSSRQQEGL